MPIPIISGLFKGKAGEIAKDVIGGLDSLFTSKEEKLQKEIELTEAINRHLISMEQEVTKQAVSEDQAITSRWQADMASESWLSKNTRPTVLLSLIAFLFIIIVVDSIDTISFTVEPAYITLLEILTTTVVVAYFGSRGVEKYKTIHEAKNLKR